MTNGKFAKLLILILITGASIALAVSGFFILPDSVILQILPSGAIGLRVPKLLGLSLAFLLTVGSSVAFFRSKRGTVMILTMTVGLLLFLLIFSFNPV